MRTTVWIDHFIIRIIPHLRNSERYHQNNRNQFYKRMEAIRETQTKTITNIEKSNIISCRDLKLILSGLNIKMSVYSSKPWTIAERTCSHQGENLKLKMKSAMKKKKNSSPNNDSDNLGFTMIKAGQKRILQKLKDHSRRSDEVQQWSYNWVTHMERGLHVILSQF